MYKYCIVLLSYAKNRVSGSILVSACLAVLSTFPERDHEPRCAWRCTPQYGAVVPYVRTHVTRANPRADIACAMRMISSLSSASPCPLPLPRSPRPSRRRRHQRSRRRARRPGRDSWRAEQGPARSLRRRSIPLTAPPPTPSHRPSAADFCLVPRPPRPRALLLGAHSRYTCWCTLICVVLTLAVS